MKYQPVNLGQGFTDYPVPQYITDALATTANSSNCLLNQYTRGFVCISRSMFFLALFFSVVGFFRNFTIWKLLSVLLFCYATMTSHFLAGFVVAYRQLIRINCQIGFLIFSMDKKSRTKNVVIMTKIFLSHSYTIFG